MNAYPMNNPMVNFLRDVQDHGNLFHDYQLDIKFSLGMCSSCKEKKYMRKESNCLSGGRYCVINSNFRSNALALETLRQICIRKIEGTTKLVNYMVTLKGTLEKLDTISDKSFSSYSSIAMA